MLERAEGPAPEAVETQLSADGGWWWNGAEWVPAVSADGLWRWTGDGWEPSVPVDPGDPPAVVATLDRLVDDRFAEGGHLLALRAHEWRPRTPELAELVAQAAPPTARLAAIDAQLAGWDGQAPRPSLRGLLGGGERPQLEQEARELEHEIRPLAALIGRTAPQPSLKDADEILVPARRLHERVLELQRAVAEQSRLAGEQAERIAAARAEVERAEEGRDQAVADLEERVRAREAEHRRAVEELMAALRSLRVPGAGEPRATFQGMTLYDHRVDTPDGRGPLDGARARVGTAAELVEQEPDVIGELWLLDATHATRLHDAIATGEGGRFVLVATTRVASVVPVPPGSEPDAEAFVVSLEGTVTDGAKHRREWREQVAAAEAALEAALGDTTAVDEARAELEASRADPDLSAPVAEAERRLAEAERPTPAMEAAAERVAALTRDLLTPPEPLRRAAAG